MKKINMILCAAVLTCAAFMVSCQKDVEPPVLTDVTTKEYSNTYDFVSLTTVETVSQKEVDADGNNVTHADVVTTTVQNALSGEGTAAATISWNDSKTSKGFKQYNLRINSVYCNNKQKVGTGNFEDLGENWFNYYSTTFYKKNGKYYTQNLQPVTGNPEADNVTLTYTEVNVDDQIGWKPKNDKRVNIVTTTTVYTLVLKASASL